MGRHGGLPLRHQAFSRVPSSMSDRCLPICLQEAIEEEYCKRGRFSAFVPQTALMPLEKRMKEFSVIIERDEEGWFVATVPGLRGCHTQAKSLDQLMELVKEVIELCLEAGRAA